MAGRPRGTGKRTTKMCPDCKVSMPREAFQSRNRPECPGAVHSYCRECKNKRSGETQRRNREAATQRAGEWRKNNKDRSSSIVLKHMYGISLDDYYEMFDSQGGVCKICSRPAGERRLCVDHCHDSKVVRGLLCQTCNTGLGMFFDSIENLNNAIQYLRDSRTGK